VRLFIGKQEMGMQRVVLGCGKESDPIKGRIRAGKVFIPLLLFLVSNTICEKVYRTLGSYSTQSPDGKFRAIADTSSKKIKLMRMSDSTIVDSLIGCATTHEALPIWMSDSVMTYLFEQNDSISLYSYEVNHRIFRLFGKQCQCNQTFSRTLVFMEDKKSFSIDSLMKRYPENKIVGKGCLSRGTSKP
jgi:hypothetical protein